VESIFGPKDAATQSREGLLDSGRSWVKAKKLYRLLPGYFAWFAHC